MQANLKSRVNRLFLILGGFFIANALLAEFIGVKIFQLESTLGFDPVSWQVFGIENLSFQLTAGVLLWPVVFVMTDVINEYYGRRGVRMLSWLAVGLIVYAFIMILLAINLTPAGWWTGNAVQAGVPDLDAAFRQIFGQGAWIIAGSVTAFLIGQITDIIIFQRIKRLTGERMLWLRATGSTLVSQLIDSFIVLFIAFYLGNNWSMQQVLAIGAMNYAYKFIMAIALTPVIYGAHYAIDGYLGHEQAEQMRLEAVAK